MKKVFIPVGLVLIVGFIYFLMFSSGSSVNEAFAGPENSLTDVLWIGPTGAELSVNSVPAEIISSADKALMAYFGGQSNFEIVRTPFPNSEPPKDMIEFLKAEGADHGVKLDVLTDSTGYSFKLRVWPGLSGEVDIFSDKSIDDIANYAILELTHPATGTKVISIDDSLVTTELQPDLPSKVHFWRKVSVLDSTYFLPDSRIKLKHCDITLKCPDDWEIYTGISGSRKEAGLFTFKGGNPELGDILREAR